MNRLLAIALLTSSCLIIRSATAVPKKQEHGDSCIITAENKRGTCVFETECTKRNSPAQPYFETCGSSYTDGTPIICCAVKSTPTTPYGENSTTVRDDDNDKSSSYSTNELSTINSNERNNESNDNAIETKFFTGNRNRPGDFFDAGTNVGVKPRATQSTKYHNSLGYNTLDSIDYKKPPFANSNNRDSYNNAQYHVSGNVAYNPVNPYNNGINTPNNINNNQHPSLTTGAVQHHQQETSNGILRNNPLASFENSSQSWNAGQTVYNADSNLRNNANAFDRNLSSTSITGNKNGYNSGGGVSSQRGWNNDQTNTDPQLYNRNGNNDKNVNTDVGDSGSSGQSDFHRTNNSTQTRESNHRGQGQGNSGGATTTTTTTTGANNVNVSTNRNPARRKNPNKNGTSKIKNGVAVNSNDDYADYEIYFPGEVQPTPVHRNNNDDNNNNNNDNNKSGSKTLSEIKCEEYSKLTTSTVSAVSLSIDSKKQPIDINNCKDALTLIVGGSKADLGEFPHMVALGYRSINGLVYHCGGTLISDQYVMTAAHCAQTTLGSPAEARLGDLNLVQDDDGAVPVNINVAEVIIHRDYKPPILYNDIALLRLDQKVKFTKNIRPACIVPRNFSDGDKVIATGWGTTNYGDLPSDDLLKVSFDVLNNKRCEQLYGNDSKVPNGIIRTMMCAAELAGGKDTCQGDSGGPLELSGTGQRCLHYVVGITSFGRVCGIANSPGIYTRISEYLPWIEGIVWKNNRR